MNVCPAGRMGRGEGQWFQGRLVCACVLQVNCGEGRGGASWEVGMLKRGRTLE